MSAAFKFSCISSFYFTFCLLVVVALFHLCLSTKSTNDATLCRDDDRRALLQFKHGLIDEADRLASWVGEKSDCCKWDGILCDNITGHVHKIHLPGKCDFDDSTTKEYEERLRGDISPSILYLNLSRSKFGGTIPPQVGNLTELRILCLGSYYDDDTGEYESTSIVNMQWLLSLRLLRHLDMSGVDLTQATDWFQVINTLPSLVQLHLSSCQLRDIYPYVASVNLTFLSSLDLSRNKINKKLMPRWIFSITSLVSLDLSGCGLHDLIPSSINSFYNLTSLKLLHISGNKFMSSSLALKGLSSIGGNLISLGMSSCGISSPTLDSIHNLTSLLSLDLWGNQLTQKIPKSLGNLCNLRDINMGGICWSIEAACLKKQLNYSASCLKCELAFNSEGKEGKRNMIWVPIWNFRMG
ncbi:hypothetical protein L1987_24902 [Smallanthus sonchifolius]|uniref:Uncharacterized protein n=1 Tax=Smallanthus sonchifolius TaxID=185202 RepID=A0ACB9ILX1_9ASTR|nr:hypothetical protein L1987_24902 [Smallanthus sonchifolius]